MNETRSRSDVVKVGPILGHTLLPIARGNTWSMSTWDDSSMLGYQFYCLDEKGKNHLIGILLERRFNLPRITDRSFINWAREVIGTRGR